MGTRYFLTLACPYCAQINYDCYYAPTCDCTTWKCEHCGKEFDIKATFSTEEMAEYAEEQEAHSKMIETLVSGLEPSAPQPVISQLAIAIEETLIVYHEPHFIRWACRALQGLIDKNFSPIEHMTDDEACAWAGRAATECVAAVRQPVPEFLIEDAAAATRCALRAQDVMARNNDKVDSADTQKEK